MYIPTWILILVIAGVAFYYFRRHKNKNSSPEIHPLIKTAMKTSNENPTYDQMLKLDEKEFQQWLLIRNETDREKLLAEMIDHEERTGSFRKTAKKEITGAEQAVLDVFDIDKSARIVRTFGNVKKVLTDGEKEGIDLVESAIFAKAASDIVGLGEKIEKERGVEETKEDWLDGENWKEIMLKHLSKYPQRTGKKNPTYDEMLKLDKDEFKAWLFVMKEPDHQKEMLAEMIDHEERTGSFAKSKKESDTDFTKLIFDVFNRDRSKEVVDVLKRLSSTANELGYKDEHGGKGDVVTQAIWAKATSDYFGLGEKIGKEQK